MHLAEKRQHVVLTKAKHFDVFDDDHLVIVDFEKSSAKKLRRIFLVAASEEPNGLCHALRSSLEAVAIRIFPDSLDYFEISFLESGFRLIFFLQCRLRHGHYALCCTAFHSISLHPSTRFGTAAGPSCRPPAYSKEFIIVSSIRTFSTMASLK